MVDAPSGPNLDLLCVQQSDAAPICENFTMLCFDAKHLEKGLNRGGEIFGSVFSKKCPFWSILEAAKFSILDPARHNIKIYDLLVVCPFDPGHSQYC